MILLNVSNDSTCIGHLEFDRLNMTVIKSVTVIVFTCDKLIGITVSGHPYQH